MAVKFDKVNRRRFLAATFLTAPLAALANAKFIEPEWVKIRHVRIGDARPTRRIAHITDIHHKGNRAYLESVVRKINGLAPDFVCFTGDLIEDAEHLPEAIEILAGIKSPLYGVPGNHDYWAKIPFDGLVKSFAATGGGWLLDEQILTPDGQFNIIGATCRSARNPPRQPRPDTRNILLMHYPAWVKRLNSAKFDLILAGHSHGGQVRLPWYGAIIVPFGVEQYEMGLFHTRSGPLYVNPGIGWFPVPIRFCCRPEITLIEI